MNEVLTPANAVFMILCLVKDTDIGAILEQAGLNPLRLTEPGGMMTTAEVTTLARTTLTHSSDPALALHVGEDIGLEVLDLAGMLASTAPNLREAFHSVQAAIRLFSTLFRAELRETDADAALVVHIVDSSELALPLYLAELVSTATFCLMRKMVRGPFQLRALHCRHPEPAWVAEYRRIFGEGTQLHFNAPENRLVFDRQLLDLPMAKHSPGLHQHLRNETARRLASRPLPSSTSATVQQLIDESLGEAVVDLPLVAERMGLNPRTLQRRLHEEGGNFSLLMEASRYRRAREKLTQSDMSLDAIAAHLGYSEPAVFYRAFKTWSGLTPNEYRQQHQRR